MKGYKESNIIQKLVIISKIITKRNDIICHDYNRLATKNTVNLNYWQIDSKTGTENLGDYLSCVVFEYMTKINNIQTNKKLKKTKHLYAIGSILLTGFQDSTIWGSGIKDELTGLSGKITLLFNKYVRKLDIRAVRGPLTRKYLVSHGINCPKVYGDPAILMPLIYKSKRKKTSGTLLINHYTQTQRTDINSVDLKTKDYKKVIDHICASRLVISGSLHGIILAESYGIPAILLKDRDNFSLFKYKDYYYSTGRKKFPVANSIEEALSIKPPRLPDSQLIKKMQVALIESFPTDLWNE